MTSPTTIDDLCQCLTQKGYTFTRDGAVISTRGPIYLRSLTTLPEGVTLSAGGPLYLNRLTTLPEGVTFSAGGYLDLGSLTTLPEGVTLSAGGYLDLGSLTTLPEGVTLSAGGTLYLKGLTDERQRYAGRDIRLRTIDGICTRLISSRKMDEATVWLAQYFKGDLAKDKRCFVAQQGDTYAHGDTLDAALRDLRFKLAKANFDLPDLVATIRKRGTVTFNDYRLITGACSSGLREGLRSRGVDPETQEMPLAAAIELCRDGYGGNTFRQAMGVA